MSSDDGRSIAYGLVVTAGFVALDLALGRHTDIASAYALGAIVAGVTGGFRAAAVVGAFAAALAIASVLWNDTGTVEYLARVSVAGAGVLLGLGAGRLNDQVAAQLGRQELLSAVADLPEPGATLDETATHVVELLVPRFAAYAALDGGLASEQVRLAASGDRLAGARVVTEARLRARGRDIGTLTIGGSRSGAGEPDFLRILSGRIALALDNAGLSQELVTVEQQLQAILENLGEAVTVQDRSGRLVFANRAAAELLGSQSVEDLLATDPLDLVARFTSTTEDGRPLDPAALPGRAVLEGREADALLLRTVNNETGEESWRRTKATAVSGPRGDVLLAVNVIEDLTDTKRAEVSQRLLSDASAALTSSLDYRETLHAVAALVVPALADWCAFDISRGEGVERASVMPQDGEDDPEEDAVVTVPMVTADRMVGVLSLATHRSHRRLGQAEFDLALELGRRCASAMENARLYRQLERVATTLQRGLLPPALPDVPGWQFDSLYLPAGGEAEVGGDFYDVFPTAAGWMAVLGDVAGRGPAAASLTAMGRYTLRTAGSLVGTPTLALARLNDNLRERGELALCTAVIVLLREGSNNATVVCAGHPLPFLVRDGKASQIGRIGPLLGAFEHAHWLPASLELAPGDILVLYTDGVLDTRAGRERFGEERLEQTLAGTASAQQAVERIGAALAEFAVGERDDDTAVLAIAKL